jgi:hypothetical protein
MITFPAKIRVVDDWKFRSKSNPYQWYSVKLWSNGKITCGCPAVKKCWHVKRIEGFKK